MAELAHTHGPRYESTMNLLYLSLLSRDWATLRHRIIVVSARFSTLGSLVQATSSKRCNIL